MHLGKMTCEIGLADKYLLRGVHGIEIKKSVHQIVQTAKVELPLSVLLKNEDFAERIKLSEKIKEGDKITLAFGYNGNHTEEFSGYIKRINPKQPLELECEDEMYLLRKLNLKKSFPKNDIKDILQYLCDEVFAAFKIRFVLYENLPQIEVKNFLINNKNGLWVLQELSDKYLLGSYLINIKGEKVLYAGLTYGRENNLVKHVLNKNTISIDDLKYNTDAEKWKVIATVKKNDGKTETITFGDKDAENVEKIELPDVNNSTLQHIGEAKLAEKQSAGYKGSFETFLKPACEPGDISDMSDEQFADRSGSYYVGTVTTTFGTGGGKRKVEIDITIR